MIFSDWHIHSENSYDASLPITVIAENAAQMGLRRIGITEHLNLNDEKFLGSVAASANSVQRLQKEYPMLVSGVELTPVEIPLFDYVAENGTREGYVPPVQPEPYAFKLAATKDALIKFGVRYAVGAAHWSLFGPGVCRTAIEDHIQSWYCQQMFLACDERVTILGHPWYNGAGLWYDDFRVIPRSMNLELAAALKENGKFVECNAHFFYGKTTERFRCQYAEFLRELFEMGIPVTYGSDAHHRYADARPGVEKYLSAAGFADGDIADLSEKDFW